jgi:hypothetical protein
MKTDLIRIPQLQTSRVPQLFFGESSAPVTLSRREKIADRLFVYLQLISIFLFLFAGLIGYSLYQFRGLLIFALSGYLIGVWMRRSLGIRGIKPTTGFFIRMRERASGSKPGLLEWLLEKLSCNEFSRTKCKAVVQANERAVKLLKQTKSTGEQNRILADLDRKVHQILYGKNQ